MQIRYVRRTRGLALAGLTVSGVVFMGTPAMASVHSTFPLTSNRSGTATLPVATMGRAYAVRLTDGSTRRSDDYFTIGGAWPQGISMSVSGLISGTPELPQRGRVLVEAYNAQKRKQVRLEWLELTVDTGIPMLDSALIPLGTSVAGGLDTLGSNVDGLLSTAMTVAGCLTDPQPPPGCLFAAL